MGRLAGGPKDPGDLAAVDPAQSLDGEERLARPLGLHRGADPLQPAQQPLPQLRLANRVGRDQLQRRTAGKRLPQGHAGMNAALFGSAGDLAQRLAGAGQRGERYGFIEPAGTSNPERETGDQKAGHHTNVCSYR